MTPSKLKEKYLEHNPNGLFFDKKTMAFFGDTMKNFGCYQEGDCYILYRKTPVKHFANVEFKFDAKTFKYLGVIK